MKPHVISYMVASIDGRILPSQWRPDDAVQKGLFERLHEVLGGDAWLVDRITGKQFALFRTHMLIATKPQGS